MDFKKLAIGQYKVDNNTEYEAIDKVNKMLSDIGDTSLFAEVINNTITDTLLSRVVCDAFIERGLSKFDDNELYVTIKFMKGSKELTFTLGSVVIDEESKFIHGVLIV